MKRLIVLSAMALTACTIGHETDIDVAAARREMNIESRHAASGCTFVKDHEAYKNCLINTYKLNSPATYSTSTLEDGRAVAIVNPTKQQGTGATSACGLKPLPSSLDGGYEWAAPTTATETKTVETVCQKKFEPQQTVIQTVEEKVAPPEPEIIFVQQEPPQPEVVQTQVEFVAPQPEEFQQVIIAEPPQPQEVVWTQPVEVEPVCPCTDPNDPCPQCYDK